MCSYISSFFARSTNEANPATDGQGNEENENNAILDEGAQEDNREVEATTNEYESLSLSWPISVEDFPEGAGTLPNNLEFSFGTRNGIPLQWQFYMRKYADGAVGIFLRLNPVSTELLNDQNRRDDRVIGKFRVGVLNPGTQEEALSARTEPWNFVARRPYGHRRLFMFSELDRYKCGNCNTVELRIVFELKRTEAPPSNQDELQEISRQQCTSDIYNQIDNESIKDVVLVTSDSKRVLAHRFLLTARSNYFKNEFEKINSEELQSQQVNELNVDYSEETMNTVLGHIYTGQLISAVENLEEESLIEVLKAADTYQLENLKQYILQQNPQLGSYIGPQNEAIGVDSNDNINHMNPVDNVENDNDDNEVEPMENEDDNVVDNDNNVMD